jgi:hypothetical protein
MATRIQITYPLNNETDVPLVFNITWDTWANRDISYPIVVEIDTKDTFDSIDDLAPLFTDSINGSLFAYSIIVLGYGYHLYTRIRVQNADGFEYSDVVSFTTLLSSNTDPGNNLLGGHADSRYGPQVSGGDSSSQFSFSALDGDDSIYGGNSISEFGTAGECSETIVGIINCKILSPTGKWKDFNTIHKYWEVLKGMERVYGSVLKPGDVAPEPKISDYPDLET